MEKKLQIKTSVDDIGCRLDVWLERNISDMSRTRIQSLIKAGNVTLNGSTVSSHQKILADMEFEVNVPEPESTKLIAEHISIDVIYEDSDIIVINKAAGIVVHPAVGHPSGTLVNALLYHCKDLAGIGGEIRPGIVHRLDKDTTGVMVVAKNESAMASLTSQFRAGTVFKEYYAILKGVPRPLTGGIETLIGRSSSDRKKMSTQTTSGRNAITNYEVIEVYGEYCMVSVHIETGRTHQIRVHMMHLGYPVLGDKQYGGRKNTANLNFPVNRQMLHAHKLIISHPSTKKKIEFEAPIPIDMQNVKTALQHQ